MDDATTPTRPSGKAHQPVPLSLTIDPASATRLLDLFREALEPVLSKALSQMGLPKSTPQPIAEPPPPSPSARKDVDLKLTDQAKAADLRIALLMGKVPDDAGLLIDARTFAKLLNISTATLYRLQAEQAIPTHVQLGHLKKWRLAEILEWIEADCPPLRVWSQKRQESSRRRGK